HTHLISYFFYLRRYAHLSHLHSFPTRRSSDLGERAVYGARDVLPHDHRKLDFVRDEIVDPLADEKERSDEAFARHERQCGEGLRSEEHTSELQSQSNLVCRLLLEKKKKPNWLR